MYLSKWLSNINIWMGQDLMVNYVLHILQSSCSADYLHDGIFFINSALYRIYAEITQIYPHIHKQFQIAEFAGISKTLIFRQLLSSHWA